MKYETPEDRGDGWTDWVQPVRRGYKIACCDCGLVHSMNFRIRRGRVQFQVSRNARSTAMVRRWRKRRP